MTTSKTNQGIEIPASDIPGLRDISKLSVQDRTISERELSDLIINCLPGIFYLQDQDGNYLRWNKNFEITTGYSAEEIQVLSPSELLDEHAREYMKAAIQKVYDDGYNETEVEVITKTGARLLYFLNGFSVIYEGKHCLLGAGIDLTAREASQKEVKESDKKYRSLFEQASDPILVTDFSGNFTDVNSSFCKLFGYTRKELLRMNIRSLVCPIQLEEKPLRNDLLMKGKHIFSDRRMIHKDGTTLETEANLKKFGDDSIMGIVRDVSKMRMLQKTMEQERVEQKVQEQKEITRAVIKAQEIERNTIGRELHDNVNQLLAATRMILSMAKRTAAGKKEFVDQSIRLIDSTIFEIRMLSRKHVTPVRGFDLKEQVASLIKIMEEGIGFRIQFEYDLPDLPLLTDDLKLNIYRVIQEQLNNVYKHASASRVQIKIFVENMQVKVSINDNGIGFEVGLKKTGVGIVNIINRIESFNGKVSFENNPGVGCKLDIKIPIVNPS